MSDRVHQTAPHAEELERMHALYREGGAQQAALPQAVYGDDECPHANCGQRMRAIDFRLGRYRAAVRDPLVRSWWADVGFVGRCPQCCGWVHFTIRGKRAISADEAATLPQLPGGWSNGALLLGPPR
jgi:hypothetical protein